MNVLLSILTSIILSRLSNNNILVLVLTFLLSTYLFRFKYDKRSLQVSSIFAFCISLIINSYVNLNILESTKLFNVTTILSIIGLTPIITYLLLFIANKVNNIKKKDYKLDKKLFKNSKYSIIRYFILILLAWLPVIVSFYPGIFSYDAAGQLNQTAMGKYSSHHPMVHSLFLGFLVKVADEYLGSGSIGLFIHIIIQTIIFALSLAYLVDYLSKDKTNFIIKFLTLLAFMFLPIFPIMAATVTKDVLFAAFYLVLSINIIELIKKQDKYLNKTSNIIILIIFSVLTILFRNNALYAFCLFLPFILFYLRKYIFHGIIIIGVSALIIFGVNKYIDYNYEPDLPAAREALSLPIQFMGRLYNTEELSEKDAEDIQKFFKNKRLHSYKEHISDPIKNTMYKGYIAKHVGKFATLFLRLSIKYPVTLIDSFLLTNETYFNPFDEIPDDDVYRVLWEIRDNDDFSNYDIEFRFKENKIAGSYYALLEMGRYNEFPIFKLIFNISIYIYVLVFALFMFVLRKEYKRVLGILPFITLFITVLLGPVAILRYVLPIVLACPLFMHMIIKKED